MALLLGPPGRERLSVRYARRIVPVTETQPFANVNGRKLLFLSLTASQSLEISYLVTITMFFKPQPRVAAHLGKFLDPSCKFFDFFFFRPATLVAKP